MADKIQPVSRPIPKADGISNPMSYSTLTTPSPAFGHYFGSGKEGKDVVGQFSMMGKRQKKDSK